MITLVSKTKKIDCVFKEFENGNYNCIFPKRLKICSTCSYYIKNNNTLSDKFKYYDFALRRNTTSISLKISLVSLLLSFIAMIFGLVNLMIKLIEMSGNK